jgi:flagellar hook-basal body complex protein FliE
MAFDPISAPVGLNSKLLWQAESSQKAKGQSFGTILAQSIRDVEGSGALADQAVSRFLSGETSEIHDVAIAAQKAELSFDMFLQTRNKLVQAYQEIMRMQI